MAGNIDFLGRLRNRLGFEASDSPFGFNLEPQQPLPILFQSAKIPTEGLGSPEVAGLTSQLDEAAPEESGGFSATEALFDTLDVGGAFVRGLVGSGISALQGDLGQAGERLLSAFPGSETVAPMLGMGKGTAPTGEDLLTDLGMERGSTAEDERRVRIAKAAGLTEYEARDKFGKFGDKRPPPDLLREFEALTKEAKESNPNLDLGATWEDTKAAADLGDVAGIGVEILTDPLTYLSFGATSVGKAAKALSAAEKAAPGLKGLLRTAGTLDDAKAILKGAKLPEKQLSRLTGLLTDAWKSGKPELELGATMGERAAKGQTALLTFGGQPVVKGEGAFKWLSTLGETDLQRSLGQGAGEGNAITETLRGFFQPIRSTFSTSTGVGALDELLHGKKVVEREGVTLANRALDKQARAIETVAKTKGVDPLELNRIVTKAAELRKAVVDEASDAVRVPINATENAAGRRWYHGTKYAGLTDETLDDISANPGGLYGPGLYLTDDKAIAETYATLRGKDAGSVFEIGVKPRAVIDAEKAMPPKVLQTVKQALRVLGINDEVAARVLGDLRDGATLTDVVKLTKEAVTDIHGGHRIGGGTGWEVLEDTLRDIYGALRKEGFDGLRHTGGQKLGKGKRLHEVLVLFDPQGSATGAGRTIGATRKVEQGALKLIKDREKSLADLSADMLKAGVTENEIAPIVAGIAEINDNIAAKLGASPIGFNELDDEMLAYMKRHATPDGKKFLGVLNDSSLLKQRTAWEGKTIPEINKYMRDKHGVKEFFHEDPIFTTRRAVHQAQRAIANAVFGEGVIKQFGGEVAEKGSKTGVDVYKALGIKLPEGEALEQLGKQAIPDDIVKFVERSAEFQKKPSKFMQFYRNATDWMKGTVTVLFPAFHGRNMLENTMKGAMEGVTPAEYKEAGQFLMGASNINSGGPGFIDAMARKAKGALQSGGKYTPEMQKLFSENGIGENLEEVVDWMSAQGVLENRITSELGAVLRDGPGGGAAKGAAQMFGGIFGTRGAPLRTGAALASGTENWHRVSLFINRLKQGYLPAEAVNEVKRVFFDFRDLTQWESALSKNFGFFYNFYRNNMRYIAQEALRHPVRSKEMLRLFERDPDNPRFRWLSSKGALKLGGVDVSLGFLPQQQFNMFDLAEGDVFDKARGKLGQLTGQANPMIGEALNLAYGEDLYTGTPLEYRTRAPDLAGAPEFVKNMLGYQETADGQGRMSWKANFFLNSIPAVGRLLQSTIAWDAKDKDFMQKLAQLTLGIGSQVKTEEELGKRDVALIDRNITREAKSLPMLRETGHATYSVDRTTVEGRILSALASPTPEEIPYLLQDDRIAARVLPYITQGPDGKPRMNRFLKDQLDQLMVELYPRHAAVFAAQKLRSKIKVKSKDQFDLTAEEGFEALFGEMK